MYIHVQSVTCLVSAIAQGAGIKQCRGNDNNLFSEYLYTAQITKQQIIEQTCSFRGLELGKNLVKLTASDSLVTGSQLLAC